MNRIMILALAPLIALAFAVVATIGGATQPVSAAADPGLAPEMSVISESAVPQAPLSGTLALAENERAGDRRCLTESTTEVYELEVFDGTGWLLGWWVTTIKRTVRHCWGPGGYTSEVIRYSRTKYWRENPIPRPSGLA